MKRETKVVVFLAAALGIAEWVSRITESSLSADVRQMVGHAQIPLDFAEARSQGRFCVMVLGNSLARAAVDEATLVDGLRARGFSNPIVRYLTPDASGINEWCTAYRKHFPTGTEKGRPDLLLLLTGRTHLLDHGVTSPEKLGAFHVGASDRARILADWLPSTGERSRFLLSLGSRLFANRERIRPLLFYNHIPGYESFARLLNTGQRREESSVTGCQARADRFGWLLDSLGIDPGRVVVVVAPLPEAYELPVVVTDTAAVRGIRVWAEPASRAWAPEAFPDGYHLGKDASHEFTQDLLRMLDMR